MNEMWKVEVVGSVEVVCLIVLYFVVVDEVIEINFVFG